jgi:Cu/Ag efflux protein CusF
MLGHPLDRRDGLAIAARLAALALVTIVLGCADDTHTVTGEIVAVDVSERHVTIAHDDIPGVMPAMTMRFAVRAPEVLAGIAPGMPVRFELEKRADELVVNGIEALREGPRLRPGIHDHSPHHGGVVTMVGMLHLEATAAPDGHVRVYLSDVWRKPLSPEGWHGTAVLDLPDGRRRIALRAEGDAVAGRGGPLAGDVVRTHLVLRKAGERSLSMHRALPLRAGVAGAAIPADDCLPPERARGAAGRLPRCTLQFPQSISAVAATPDGAAALIAVAGGGVTVWEMPAAAFKLGFAPPPPLAAPAGETPHPESANAIAVSPDGRQAVVAVEGRLLRYATASGRLLRELPGPGGVVQSVVWSPDGTRLLVLPFYDSKVRLIDAEDGREIRHLPVEREGTTAAFTADGRAAVVGTETGTLMLFTLDENGAPRVLQSVGRPLHGVALAGTRVVAAGSGGILRVVDIWTGASVAQSEATSPCYRLAAPLAGDLVACAGYDRAIRLYRRESAQLVDTLHWHQGPVAGLAWVGTTLLSGDAAGELALWDFTDLLGTS